MQRGFYIGVVLLVLLLVGAGAWLVLGRGGSGTTGQQPQTYTYPVVDNSTSVTTHVGGGTSTSTKPASTTLVTTQSGRQITVKDFIHNGETVPDTVNPGNYYLAGSIGYCLGDGTCPSGYKTDDFSITYNQSAAYFNIILLAEPIAKARDEAGRFMLDRLGVTEAQLCSLRYFVWTTAGVNGVYAGKNLGFAFCPGATPIQ